MARYLIAYIPVIHRGYLQFLTTHTEVEKIYILDIDLISHFEWLRKDIRSLQPAQVITGLNSILEKEGVKTSVELLTQPLLEKLAQEPNTEINMPNEDIMHSLAEEFFPRAKVTFDNVFLRWDKNKTVEEQNVQADSGKSLTEFQKRILAQAKELAGQSADWWRQVGAIIIKDGEVLLAGFNKHVPDQYQPLYNGDPRGNFKKGLYIELTTALHAEAALIAQAARQGISLVGTEMYITTFPCPNCAKLIAYSGITQLFFEEGYSMVDGESILKDQGVKIVKLS